MNEKDYLFCVIDLNTRQIIGHCLKENNFDVKDITELLSKKIKERYLSPEIKILHAKKELLFQSQQYLKFVKKHNNITAKTDSNKSIKDLFELLKNNIKKLLKNNKKILLDHFQSIKEKEFFLENIVEDYNKKPHKALFKLSPNNLKEALFLQKQSANIVEKLETQTSREDERKMNKTIVNNYLGFEKYVGDWKEFFLNYHLETSKKHR